MVSPLVRLAAVALLTVATAGCTTGSSNTMTAGAPITSPSSLIKPSAYAPTADEKVAKPYFISFRSRSAMSYGHSFVIFGKRDEQGRVPMDRNGVLRPDMAEIAGLHPATSSNVPYTIGHVLPVPSETGPSDGDSEQAYMTAQFTIPLTEAQYRDVAAYIHKRQKDSPLWHAVLYNCSSWIGEIAQHMGLKTPNSVLFPKEYVTELKKMNS
ncbi:hypothetical protein [Aurantimonas sp. VKM B-3413]|uniref:hypothetical protein n=1 Tax=Aurantimonas sp. VKM B-3413 TaxID=2779401 RepID=UPI001E579BAC|nr:hypothetical protein [Aurantimonas sp. VKM B-3413]MCB8837769.1 hypothetical protein [Aurantimonas sp. VKM B-3413]